MAIQDLRITNPQNYRYPGFLDLKQCKIAVALPSTLTMREDRLVIDELIIDINAIGYVIDKDRNNNIVEFIKALPGTPTASSKQPDKTPETKQPHGRENPPPLQLLIRHFVLRLNQIDFADYSKGKPKVDTYKANIDIALKDVTGVKQAVTLLQEKLLAQQALDLFENLESLVTDLNMPAHLEETLRSMSANVSNASKGRVQESVKKAVQPLRTLWEE